ncbi:hypothetical protein Pcinc_022969 [Petrolisthes cinctipes]|uniref:Uncharacterized protein n=1 Tax=Petrolisthes cinctipes TaxID=88211 RepID=A0AAE1FCV8_PETCI|nr:hypothetical protein Pcinc_022969 [Petrolisthes cinctipes]
MDSSGSSEDLLDTSLESSPSDAGGLEDPHYHAPHRPSPFTLRSQCANDKCPMGTGILFRSRISPSPSKQRVWNRRRRRSDQSHLDNTTTTISYQDLSHDLSHLHDHSHHHHDHSHHHHTHVHDPRHHHHNHVQDPSHHHHTHVHGHTQVYHVQAHHDLIDSLTHTHSHPKEHSSQNNIQDSQTDHLTQTGLTHSTQTHQTRHTHTTSQDQTDHTLTNHNHTPKDHGRTLRSRRLEVSTDKPRQLRVGEMLRHRSRTPRGKKKASSSPAITRGEETEERSDGGSVSGGMASIATAVKKNVLEFLSPSKTDTSLPSIVESSESGFEEGTLFGEAVSTSTPASDQFVGARQFFQERDTREKLISDYFSPGDTPSNLRESTRRLTLRKPFNRYIAYSSDEELEEWQ